MSSGARRPFDEVAPIAAELQQLLAPSCERVVIAGSLRRRRAMVSDIELVAIPRIENEQVPGLFVEHSERRPRNRLTDVLAELQASGTLTAREVTVRRTDGRIESQHRLGERYRALEYDARRWGYTGGAIPVDLFITDVDSWGAIFTIRTGSADFVHELVTAIQKYFRKVEGGRLLHLGRPVPTPTEEAFLAACGQRWIDPPEREPGRVRIDPSRFPAEVRA